jgi:peptide deformylase
MRPADMTAGPILRFPNPRLYEPAAAVAVFDGALAALAGDLLAAMRAAPGIGIAAPHIGVLQRLVVIELSTADGVRTYVNPAVEWTSIDLVRHQEGSVSMPGVSEAIERPARVRVRCQDLTGAPRLEEADGLLAVCLQHEIDQLDGIFWIQRLSKLKRDRLVKRFGKIASRTSQG